MLCLDEIVHILSYLPFDNYCRMERLSKAIRSKLDKNVLFEGKMIGNNYEVYGEDLINEYGAIVGPNGAKHFNFEPSETFVFEKKVQSLDYEDLLLEITEGPCNYYFPFLFSSLYLHKDIDKILNSVDHLYPALLARCGMLKEAEIVCKYHNDPNFTFLEFLIEEGICPRCIELYKAGKHNEPDDHYLIPDWVFRYGCIRTSEEKYYVNNISHRRKVFVSDYQLNKTVMSRYNCRSFWILNMLADNEGYHHFAALMKLSGMDWQDSPSVETFITFNGVDDDTKKSPSITICINRNYLERDVIVINRPFKVKHFNDAFDLHRTISDFKTGIYIQ